MLRDSMPIFFRSFIIFVLYLYWREEKECSDMELNSYMHRNCEFEGPLDYFDLLLF
jgi:hypothetical protein